jgi:hypothetical protein
MPQDSVLWSVLELFFQMGYKCKCYVRVTGVQGHIAGDPPKWRFYFYLCKSHPKDERSQRVRFNTRSSYNMMQTEGHLDTKDMPVERLVVLQKPLNACHLQQLLNI